MNWTFENNMNEYLGKDKTGRKRNQLLEQLRNIKGRDKTIELWSHMSNDMES